jgi:hypothetical protein
MEATQNHEVQMEQKKIPVSRRALLARVNRILAKKDQALRISRSHGERSNLGEAYILDTHKNSPVFMNVNLKDLAEELGAIKAFEEMADD